MVKQPKILNDNSDFDKDKYVAKPSNPNINFQFKKKVLKRTSTSDIVSSNTSQNNEKDQTKRRTSNLVSDLQLDL